jgi:hypothetical protein
MKCAINFYPISCHLGRGPKWQDCFLLFFARAQKVVNKGWRTTIWKIGFYGVLSKMHIGVMTARTTVLLPDITTDSTVTEATPPHAIRRLEI